MIGEEKLKIAKEEERQKQIIEREERAARRELEQLQIDKLKLQIDLESRGHNPGNDTNRKSAPKDTIKVRKYDSQKEKMDVYLDYFESIMAMKGYDEEDWPAQLMTQLTGEAFEAYNSIAKEDKNIYKNVKKALLCHFGKSENDYRKEFHEMRIKMDKDPQIIVHEAQVKLTKWLELTAIDTSNPKAILDMVLIDKFLENATPALFTYLTDKKVRTQAELTNALRTFKDSHPNVEMDKRQDIFAAIQIKSQEKRQGMRNQSLPNQGNRQTICWYCNKPGHMAKQCYHNKGQPNRVSPNGSPIRKKTEEKSRQDHFENKGRQAWKEKYHNSKHRDYDQERQSWRERNNHNSRHRDYDQSRQSWREKYNHNSRHRDYDQERQSWRERNNHNSINRDYNQSRRSWRGKYNFDSRKRNYDQSIQSWRKNENQDMNDRKIIKLNRAQKETSDTVATIDNQIYDRRKMNQEETSTCDTLATIKNQVYGKRDENHSTRDKDGTSESETIRVESSEVGRTIGCLLSRMKDIDKDNDFQIKLSDSDSSGRNSIELSGSSFDISKAKRLIQDAGIDIVNGHNRSRGW